METAQPPQNSQQLRPDEQSSYKGRLQQYSQRAGLDLPVYIITQTAVPHACEYKCSVIVDDDTYDSSSTFPQKKAAEQDAAKCALKVIFEKRVEKGSSIIRMIAISCKAMLNEFAARVQVERPKYNTVKIQELPLPVFVSTLQFRGVSYTGGPSKNKRDAEQLVAEDAIISIMGDSEVGLTLLQILKSKAKLFSSSQLSKDPSSCAIRLEEGSNSAGDGASSGQLVSGSDVLMSTNNEEQFKDAIPSNTCALQTQGAPVPSLIQNHATPAMQTLANEGGKVTPPLQADNSVFPLLSLSQNHSTTPFLTNPNEGCKITYVLQADRYVLPMPSSPQNPSIPPVLVFASEGCKVSSASQADGSVFLMPSTAPAQVFANQGCKITPASQAQGSVIHVGPSSEDPSCEITAVPQVDSSVLPELPQNPTAPLQNVADQSLKVTSAPQAAVGLQSYYPPQTHVLSTMAAPLIQDGSAALSSQSTGKRIRNRRYKANKKARMANQMGGSLSSTLAQQS